MVLVGEYVPEETIKNYSVYVDGHVFCETPDSRMAIYKFLSAFYLFNLSSSGFKCTPEKNKQAVVKRARRKSSLMPEDKGEVKVAKNQMDKSSCAVIPQMTRTVVFLGRRLLNVWNLDTTEISYLEKRSLRQLDGRFAAAHLNAQMASGLNKAARKTLQDSEDE